MTLLSLCQNAASNCGIGEGLTTIVNNSSEDAQRLLALARRTGIALYKRANWTALVVEYTFVTTGVSDYALPADFGRLIDGTLWDRSRFWQLRGAQSPQQWQLYKSSVFGKATIQQRWRIRIPSGSGAGVAPVFSIDPPISATDTTSTFVFEYVSSHWCASATGTPQSNWVADTDVGIVDEDLIELGVTWRMLHRLGLAYDEEKDEYDREVDKAIARDGGNAVFSLVGGPGVQFLSTLNVPETGFGR